MPDVLKQPGNMMQADVAVIGGGIVGLATAYQFTHQFPSRRVVVLEKEANVAAHQRQSHSRFAAR
jgi:L-2-hydroxyglutarate oxidase